MWKSDSDAYRAVIGADARLGTCAGAHVGK
jgi:hypothetical protein